MDLDNLTIEEQFNLFGCGSRCIMKLAALQDKPISKEDFISKFSYLFPPKRCGLTNTAEQIEMAKSLGLCKTAVALRDLRKVLSLISEGRYKGILFMTDRNNKGEELFHCRLVLGINDEYVRLFSPCQSGADYEPEHKLSDLEIELPHYLLFLS